MRRQKMRPTPTWSSSTPATEKASEKVFGELGRPRSRDAAALMAGHGHRRRRLRRPGGGRDPARAPATSCSASDSITACRRCTRAARAQRQQGWPPRRRSSPDTEFRESNSPSAGTAPARLHRLFQQEGRDNHLLRGALDPWRRIFPAGSRYRGRGAPPGGRRYA
jgi:hypothetical protein